MVYNLSGSTAATDYSGIDFIGSTSTNPTARIAVLSTGSGSYLSFGTSNAYANGVTNNALTIDYGGNVSMSGNVTVAGISRLGPVGNVQITGGAPGQFLRTDGAGTLTWVAAGGTANVAGAPTQVQFNTGGAMDASANFTFDKTTNTLVVTNATNSGNLSVSGNATVAGNLNVTSGNMVASANISLIGGTTNNKLVFNTNGVAAPILNGTSIGTRMILYTAQSTTSTNFALGIEPSSMWYSVPDTASFHRWYGCTTQLAYLTGTGLSVTGNIFASANISTVGNILAAGLHSVTGTISSTGAIATPSTISATGNINTAATLNAAVLSVTGAAIHTGVINTTSTISATGSITTASTVSATGTITGGNIVTAGAISATGIISATGNIITAGYIQAAGLASSGNMAIPAGNSLLMGTNAGTSAKIIWDAAGAAPPSYNAFSAGTKLVLYPATVSPYTPSASEVGYALGIENSSLWYSTSNYANGFHRWYAGNTQIANLNYQAFTAAGNLIGANVSTAGSMSSTGNATHGNVLTAGNISAGAGILTGGTISAYGTATLGNVIVPTGGTISAIGNIQGGNIVANGIVTGVTLSASGNVTGFNLTTGGSMSASFS